MSRTQMIFIGTSIAAITILIIAFSPVGQYFSLSPLPLGPRPVNLTKSVEGVVGKPRVFPLSVLGGKITDIIYKGEKTLALGPVVASVNNNATYPLSGPGIAVGRIFRKEPDQTTQPVALADVKPEDQVYLTFYRNGASYLGVIVDTGKTAAGLTLRFLDDPQNSALVIPTSTPFTVKDTSGYFWKKGDGLDKLKIGDIVEVTMGDDGRAESAVFMAPSLGGGRGTITIVNKSRNETIIRLGGPETLLIVVDDKTSIGRENDANIRFKRSDLSNGQPAWVVYFMDEGRPRAVSVSL